MKRPMRSTLRFLNAGKSIAVISLAIGASAGYGFAQAAPFCTYGSGQTLECIHYDARPCRAASTDQGSACVANPAAQWMMQGGGGFCVALSNGVAQCLYPDFAACDRAARIAGGVCLDRSSRAAAVAPAVTPAVTPSALGK